MAGTILIKSTNNMYDFALSYQDFKTKTDKSNWNKQQLTSTAAWSAYLLYRNRAHYQPSYHVLN